MSYDIVALVPDYRDVFLGEANVEGGLPFQEHLDRSRLDFSLESLHEVDNYLSIVHQHYEELEDTQYNNVVMATGCYLGEVIRRNASRNYRWINYDDYFSNRRSELANLIPETLGTLALLEVPGREVMTMPINKVVRYLEEGPENNTHYYASIEVQQA